jgi:hypothetical protein
LGNVEAQRCASHGLLFGDSHEVSKMPKLHLLDDTRRESAAVPAPADLSTSQTRAGCRFSMRPRWRAGCTGPGA